MKPKPFWRYVCAAVAVALAVTACSSSAGVPEPVRQLVFEASRFASPVTISVPADETRTYRNLRQKYPNGKVGGFLGLMPVGVAIEYNNIPKGWRQFLVRYGYVKILSLTLQGRSTRQYRFIGYTDKLKKVLVRTDGSSIIVATRELKSIDYRHKYTAEIRGVDIPFYSLTFSYNLDENTPDVPKVDSVFAGKATAYLDPRDGQWKLDKLSLEDRGGNEYLRLIRNSLNETN